MCTEPDVRRNMLDFAGKTVLITGGASGIGEATAIAFAEHGASICIADTNVDSGERVVDQLRRMGRQAAFMRTDVTCAAEVKAAVVKTVSLFGALDCAFNNAGISAPAAPLGAMDESTFDRVISVDLKGIFLCLTYELQHMIQSGKGAIVNTTSVAGLVPETGSGAYVAAKHGVIGLTKTAALENAHRGIRVNALAPGWVRTPMTRKWDDDLEFNAKLKAATPMHRGAEPHELSGLVLFLCSDAASYVTGQVYVADGAQTIRGLLPPRY